MNLFMGVTLSFFLSLTGNLTAKGGFSPVAFVVSFIISTVISLVIGFIIPMRKVEGGLTKALGLRERSIPAAIVSALVSDLIYTPFMTLAMIFLARRMAMKDVPQFTRALLCSCIHYNTHRFTAVPEALAEAQRN